MKLRLRANSIRLRLSQGDLETLLRTGRVEERVEFPGGASMTYRLERLPDAEPTAEFAAGVVAIGFPAAMIERWSGPDEISMKHAQALGRDRVLTLLVEKDFQCLSPREGEDDSDLFPNPGA